MAGSNLIIKLILPTDYLMQRRESELKGFSG